MTVSPDLLTSNLYDEKPLKYNLLRPIHETVSQNSGHRLVASHPKMESKVTISGFHPVFSHTKLLPDESHALLIRAGFLRQVPHASISNYHPN